MKQLNSKTSTYVLWLIGLLLIVLVLDAGVKHWIHTHIGLMEFSPPFYPYGGIGIFKNFFGIQFSINHATNRGAAWSLWADQAHALLIIRLVFISLLGIYIFYKKRPLLLQSAFVLIFAGALGNILDFFFYGHVIDMFHFVFWGYSFPIFNIADSAIFCGVVMALILDFFRKHQ